MLVRLVNMRGVNLNAFDFDYDLTWVGFFMNANERVYGRYGGRDAGEADARLTLPGLKHAMQQARARHQREGNALPARPTQPETTAEQLPGARRLKSDQCIHCHMVYDWRRDEAMAKNTWRNEMSWDWLPPQPEQVGLTMDVNRGNRIATVAPNSIAQRGGLRLGDELVSLNGAGIGAIADLQMALRDAPRDGAISVSWQRGAQRMAGQLQVSGHWKHGDLSWRAFMWGLSPRASVYGKDLTAEEKKPLGLSPKQLAFRQGGFVPPAARDAGLRANDIIIGIDGKLLEMTMLQFNAWIRLNFQVGDHITFNVIRGGQRLPIPMTLSTRG